MTHPDEAVEGSASDPLTPPQRAIRAGSVTGGGDLMSASALAAVLGARDA